EKLRAFRPAPLDTGDSILRITPLSRITTGVWDSSAAEIVSFDPTTDRALFINADGGVVEVYNLADPANPVQVTSLDAAADAQATASSTLSGVNSVAVSNGLAAVAVEADPKSDPGAVAFYNITQPSPAFLGAIEVGALPDSLTFTPDGSTVIVANEGEPNIAGVDLTNFPDNVDLAQDVIDPEGSVSIIAVPGALDLTFQDNLTVETATFTAFNGTEAILETQGVLFPGRAANPATTVAQDLEPEFVTTDGTTAWVTLQEANAVAVVDIATATVTAVLGLGFKDHMIPGFGLDGSDRDGIGDNAPAVNIREWPLLGAYQPDTIATYEAFGRRYLVTANEGDARDYEVEVEGEDEVLFSFEERIEDVTLDATAFPDAADLQSDLTIGRLDCQPIFGDDDNDDDLDRIITFGARSFSIWDAVTGELVYDSGNDFEVVTARRFGLNFNSTNDENDGDGRSDAKGPEPEAVAVGQIGGAFYAFIGLERIGGVMVYDVTIPSAPFFVTYFEGFTPRNFTLTESELESAVTSESSGAPDLGPESIVFVPAADSPGATPLLLVGNEVSGTVSVYGVEQAP
ncbi:MAG: choice-of-anchor I family protein, partial [Myxococcota bacterium]